MRGTDPLPLKHVIDKLLDTYKLRGKLSELQLKDSWVQIVGKVIAGHTTDLQIKNGKLIISLDSPVMRQELSYMKEKVRIRLNQELGRNVIQEIIFR
ncbi:MAG: DUF721 domain-containing protein [Bacteroidia bacterium]